MFAESIRFTILCISAAKLLNLAEVLGVSGEAYHAYSIQSTW